MVDACTCECLTLIADIALSERRVMLLYLSSGAACCRLHTRMPVDFTNDVSLQASNDLALALSVSSSFGHASPCRLVIAHADDGYPIEGRIGLAIATAVQAHAVRVAA